MSDIFFDSWDALIRTITFGLLSYIFMVFILRVTGKRTVSKWNSFDLVVTVALGSSLSTVFLSGNTSLAQGAVGFSILILMQYVVTWLNVRSRMVQKVIKAKPALLLHKGRFMKETMEHERVPVSEILAAVRSHGIANIEEVGAVILETDGNFSVIANLGESQSALADIEGFQDSHSIH